MFKFKDVDVTFNFNKLPKYDQEYIKTMTYETVGTHSVRNTGISFDKTYPNANNFMLFNDESKMHAAMSEFAHKMDCTASHLLHGKKYWLAWTYEG